MDGVERGAFSRIGRGDVEDHQLVRPLGLVAHRALDRIAGVADVREADALDDAAVADVEAGDDALRDGVRRGHARARLAEVDAPLEQRLADHAIDADPGERHDVGQGRDAARGNDAQRRLQRSIEIEGWPAQSPVFADVGDERLADAERLDAREHLGERRPRVALPSGHADDAVADVDRGDDALRADGVDDRGQDLGGIGSNGADDDFLRAGIEPRPSIGDGADAAADLHAQIALRQPPDHVNFGRLAAARALEVDDVQPRAARHVERVEHRLGVAVRRDPREVAVLQPDSVALQQVDRRDHVHATKSLSTCRPAFDDFSGWNCTPKTRPFWTAATKGPP